MKLLGLFFIQFIFSITTLADTCQSVKASFDLGSGEFKAKIALVDVCEKKILKTLKTLSAPTKLNAGYNSTTKLINEETLDKAKLALIQFTSDAILHDASSIEGVATQIFREASNAQELITSITSLFPRAKISVLSQEQEGKLGYYSALLNISNPSPDLVVWDMGGKSAQFTQKNDRGFQYFNTRIASSEGRNAALVAQGYPLPSKVTPNPIVPSIAKMAQESLMTSIQKERSKSEILNFPNSVFAIGSVLAKSNVEATGQTKQYNKKDLKKGIQKLTGMQDATIKSLLSTNYPESVVSNLILTLAYMEVLGIKKVNVIPVNLTDGLLVFGLEQI